MNMNRHCGIIKFILLGVVCISLLPVSVHAQKYTEFISGEVWKDTDGNPINAHGGGLLYLNGTYYWYGEYKKGKTILPDWATWECYRTDVTGVGCYSSKDLLNWKFEGIVLPAVVIRAMILNYIGEVPDRICWSVGILVPVLLYAAVFISKNSVASYQVLCTDVTILALGMLVADLLHTDYSALGILTITFMYAFRKNHVKSVLAGCIALTVFNSIEITSFFTLIPVKKYNGERGLSMKYFFYAFYPVHLFLLYLISRYVV